MGHRGTAFVAQPQIPLCNINWSSEGKWVRLAKIGFERYFSGRMRAGRLEPVYEHPALEMPGIDKLDP
jgi:sulfide:quinone oxidoreductase